MSTARLLPPDEWTKLEALEPYRSAGLPSPAHWIIVVVEEEDRIVASCALFDTVHWDGFAIDPAYQKNPVVFRQLLDLSVSTLQAHDVTGVHITVPDDQPELRAMVERFGFVRAPGTLYLYAVPHRASFREND